MLIIMKNNIDCRLLRVFYMKFEDMFYDIWRTIYELIIYLAIMS